MQQIECMLLDKQRTYNICTAYQYNMTRGVIN